MKTNTAQSISVSPENASKLANWLANRGGIAVWRNADLGSADVGAESLTPANDELGNPYGSPGWRFTNKPDRICTDPGEVFVQAWREVKRVKVRPGSPWSGGVCRADRAKLDKAIAAAGEGATYRFDYGSRNYGSPWFEVAIEVPSTAIGLADWLASEAAKQDASRSNVSPVSTPNANANA